MASPIDFNKIDPLKEQMESLKSMCTSINIPGPLDFITPELVIINIIMITYEEHLKSIVSEYDKLKKTEENENGLTDDEVKAEVDKEVKKLVGEFNETAEEEIKVKIEEVKMLGSNLKDAATEIPKTFSSISINAAVPTFAGVGSPVPIWHIIDTLIKIAAIIQVIKTALSVAKRTCLLLYELKVPMPSPVSGMVGTLTSLLGDAESAAEESTKALNENTKDCNVIQLEINALYAKKKRMKRTKSKNAVQREIDIKIKELDLCIKTNEAANKILSIPVIQDNNPLPEENILDLNVGELYGDKVISSATPPTNCEILEKEKNTKKIDTSSKTRYIK